MQENANDPTVNDLVWLIFDTSILSSGFSLDKPAEFGTRNHKLIKLGLRIFDDEPGAAASGAAPVAADDDVLALARKMTKSWKMSTNLNLE